MRIRARARRRRGRTLTEKEAAVVGAEAGERASAGMASRRASVGLGHTGPETRGKRQAGRGGDGRCRRRRGGRREPGRSIR